MTRPRAGRLVAAALAVAVLCVWYQTATEAEPSFSSLDLTGSRFQTLHDVIDSANLGYQYQLHPGVPMERVWEDPGIEFLTVTWGFVKRAAGQGPLDYWNDPQRIEMAVVLLTLACLFSGAFMLPAWFDWAVAAAFVLAVMPWWELMVGGWTAFPLGALYHEFRFGMLYLSNNMYWVKFLSAIWTFAVVLQMGTWIRESAGATDAPLFTRSRLWRLAFYGVLLGVFGTIRKDVLVSAFIGLAGALAAVPLGGLASRWKRPAVLWIGGAAIVALGAQVAPLAIQATWFARDRVYVMQPYPRIYGHPAWLPLLASLGYVPNKYGLAWSDGKTWQFLIHQPGFENVAYGTTEHERASRTLYFRLLREDPGLLPRNIAAKAKTLAREQPVLLWGALVAFAVWLTLLARGARWMATASLVVVAGTAVLPLLTHPRYLYYLDFAAACLFVICAAGAIAVMSIARLATRTAHPGGAA